MPAFKILVKSFGAARTVLPARRQGPHSPRLTVGGTPGPWLQAGMTNTGPCGPLRQGCGAAPLDQLREGAAGTQPVRAAPAPGQPAGAGGSEATGYSAANVLISFFGCMV